MRTTSSASGMLAAAMIVVAGSGTAHATKAGLGAVDCFADLMTGQSTEIVCEFPINPSAKEIDDLAKATRGYLKDVHCLVSIRITRADVMAAVNNPDHVFLAPPQPVACELDANLKHDETHVIAVGATFAPRIVIKDGIAVEATPGLATITGVSRVLSWPVETWVNRGATVRNGMLQVVNAWLGHMRSQRPPGRSSALR